MVSSVRVQCFNSLTCCSVGEEVVVVLGELDHGDAAEINALGTANHSSACTASFLEDICKEAGVYLCHG